MTSPQTTPTKLTSEELAKLHRHIGHAVTEIVAEYTASLDSRKVATEATPEQTRKLFDEAFPEQGIPVDEILERYRTEVMKHAMGISSPRYFGQFNPTPLPIGVWADALTASLNQNAGAWRNGPTSAMIEARVLRWLCDLVGYGEQSFGTLTSGGTEANLIALKCARDRAHRDAVQNGLKDAPSRLAVYASEQVHFSIDRSVDVLGLGRTALRKVKTDDRFHADPDAMRKQIAEDRKAGFIPCCVIGVAATTSTGVIDPLADLAEVARENGCWYHVDAAYGGAIALSGNHKQKLRGIEFGDSVTYDAHKWMFVPFACGAILVRDGGGVLREAFDITPEYLNEDRGGADVDFDFFRYGQLGTRRFNSLKLWMALKTLGRQGYAEIIDRQIDLTKYFGDRIDNAEAFERVGEVETAVCCFRYLPEALRNADGPQQDAIQQRLQQAIERSGEAWVTTTVVSGRRVLRLNINSFLTEQRHVDDLLELLKRVSQTL